MDPIRPRPRGRPKDAGKRTAVLDAARRLFLQHGADGVALDVVIAEAGVSKATFYANFNERAALLEAVISREAERVIQDEEAPEDGGMSLQQRLTAFGVRLLRLLFGRETLGFERLLASATGAHPNLPARLFEAGPGRSRRVLAGLIAAGVRSGELELDDPVSAAEDLCGLWQGMLRIEMAMGLVPLPGEAVLQARSARGVELFFRLYGTGRPAA